MERAEAELQDRRVENSGLKLETERLHSEMERAEAELQDRRVENSGLKLETERLHSEMERAEGERDCCRLEIDRSNAKEAQFLEEIARLTANLAALEDKAASDTASQSEETQRLLTNSQAESNRLAQELASVYGSPAWQWVAAYRKWLVRQRRTSSWIRIYENGANWLLRRFSVGPTALPQAPVPQLPLAESADTSELLGEHPESYESWISRTEPGQEQLELQRSLSRQLRLQPLFSILVPVYKVPLSVLQAMVDSVIAQTYDKWELCIVHGYAEDQEGRKYLLSVAARDSRLRIKLLDENMGISGNSNLALEMAKGDFIALLDHDDLLAPFALYEAAAFLDEKPETCLLYSDHDYIQGADAVRFSPLFKPDWSPEIMFSANYITHLTIIRTDLVRQVGGLDPSTDGAQDWDLFMRVAENTKRIEHIPKVLYHWRVHAESTALNGEAKSYAEDAQLLALSRHMDRIGMPAAPERTNCGLLHVRWRVSADRLVSIIIPTRDKVDLLRTCITSILERTDYPAYEVLVIDTGSSEPATREYYQTLQDIRQIRVLDYQGPFNYSAVNNFGAHQANGDLLLFLNNDTEITHPEWIRELGGWASWSEIGIVGGKLLLPGGTIQHAGVVIGLSGFADHPFAGLPSFTYGMYGSTEWYRNYLAVTGACMMMRKEVFDALGGFDESFVLCGSDVEICLRAREHQYRVVYNPFALLIHHERQTRGNDIPPGDFSASYKHYGRYLQGGDPYWNSNLSVWRKEIALRSKHEQTSLQFVESYLRNLSEFDRKSGLADTAKKVLAPASGPSEAEQLVSWFDFSEDEVRELKEQAVAVTGYRKVTTIVWFIPPFVNAFYGGIYTILRFAEYWRASAGVHNLFAICGSVDHTVMLDRIKQVIPECAKSDVLILPEIKSVKQLPETDAAICTLWTTAYFAMRYRKVARRFYFIQDYEPAFYSAGSASSLVESTYRLGFYGITNTVSLRESYEKEFGGKAVHFTPCVNQKLFRPSDEKRAAAEQRPWQVSCYARPTHSRNAFELLSAAVRKLKARLGNRVRIVTAGENWDPADYDLDGVVENRGLLPYEDTARLYRESDVGVVLMLTRHPSYIPMELMASGCLVVTNRNHWTTWLLEDEQTCLLCHTTATSLAETIERGLRDEALREQIIEHALELVREKYSDWTPEMAKVYDFMCSPDATIGQ
jgi:GT2 family glycosyltransferase